MTVTEAARLLGVSRQFVYELEKRGKLRVRRDPIYEKHARVQVVKADVEALRQLRDSRPPYA